MAAVALFTDAALYSVSPFSEPIVGRAALTAYWSNVAATQTDVQFDYQILAMTTELGVNHWSACFRKLKTGKLVRLDGISVVKLNSDALCTEFREWWEGTT